MDGQRGRARSFLIGGLVGASAVLATARRRRPRRPRGGPGGLAAFEEAPCYAEAIERELEAVRQQRPDVGPTS